MDDDLASATRLESVPASSAGSRCFRTELAAGWQGEFGFFGGYIAAILTRALGTLGGDQHHVLTAALSFLEPPSAGSAEVVTNVERAGSRLVTASASMRQRGRQMARLHGLLSIPRPGPAFVETSMPRVPSPDVCPPWRPDEWRDLSILERYEVRSARNGAPYTGVDIVDTAGWVRLNSPTSLDAPVVAFLADTFMPPLIARETRPLVAPTVELHVAFHVPLPSIDAAEGWFLSTLRSEFAGAGYLEQSGAIWTEDGRLLGRTRHLNHVRYVDGGDRG